MRLKDKVAIVTGAGQTPGDTVGNGRATAILFAREGARVVLVDRDLASARETQTMIEPKAVSAAPLPPMSRAPPIAAPLSKPPSPRTAA